MKIIKKKIFNFLWIYLIFFGYSIFVVENFNFLPEIDSAFRFLLSKKNIYEIPFFHASGGILIPYFFKFSGLSLLNYPTAQFILSLLSSLTLFILFLILFKSSNNIIFSLISVFIIEFNCDIVFYTTQANPRGFLILISLLFLFYYMFFKIEFKIILFFFTFLFYNHYAIIIFLPIIILYFIYNILKKKISLSNVLYFLLLIPGLIQIIYINYITKYSDNYQDYYSKPLSVQKFQNLLSLFKNIFHESFLNSYSINNLYIYFPLAIIILFIFFYFQKFLPNEKKLFYLISICFLNITLFHIFTHNDIRIRFIYFLLIYCNLLWLILLNHAIKYLKFVIIIYIVFFQIIAINHSKIIKTKYSYNTILKMYNLKVSDYKKIIEYVEENQIDYIGHLSTYSYLPYEAYKQNKNLLLSNITDNWEFHGTIIPSEKKIFSNFRNNLKEKKIIVLYENFIYKTEEKDNLHNMLKIESSSYNIIGEKIIEYHF